MVYTDSGKIYRYQDLSEFRSPEEYKEALKEVDTNNVNTWLYDNGSFFWYKGTMLWESNQSYEDQLKLYQIESERGKV